MSASARACAAPLVVLKLGSSVLGGEGDLPAAVDEIYGWVRRGRQVIAVVSAFAGTTDALRDRAHQRFERPHPAGLAALLASGEAVAAAFLALALDDAGIPVALLDPDRMGLVTSGPLLDADLAGLDVAVIRSALAEHPVVVVPGFVGRDGSGAPSLLGRGGSDLTAIYLAHRLGAGECRLLKDVDGLFDADPAAGGGTGDGTRVRPTATWAEVARVGGRLVQGKAVAWAARHRRRFTIAAPGSTAGTRVGPVAAGGCPAIVPPPAPPPLRVALLGLGTVGLGVWRRLAADPGRFCVVGIAVRDRRRARPADVPPALLTDDAIALLARPADVVVELLPGHAPAADLVRAALACGRHVVSANKQVIAHDGPGLEALAAARGVAFLHAAAVGGAVPMLERVRARAARGRIVRLSGVLNGTCNWVLDAVAGGATLADAVRAAQERGFAEADPAADLGGGDAAAKLVILARAAFGVAPPPDAVRCAGLGRTTRARVRAAARAGAVLRLVATAARAAGGVDLAVEVVALPAKHPLARVRGEHNRLLIECADGAVEDVHGKGAGGAPTSLAIMADLADLWRQGRGRQGDEVA